MVSLSLSLTPCPLQHSCRHRPAAPHCSRTRHLSMPRAAGCHRRYGRTAAARMLSLSLSPHHPTPSEFQHPRAAGELSTLSREQVQVVFVMTCLMMLPIITPRCSTAAAGQQEEQGGRGRTLLRGRRPRPEPETPGARDERGHARAPACRLHTGHKRPLRSPLGAWARFHGLKPDRGFSPK